MVEVGSGMVVAEMELGPGEWWKILFSCSDPVSFRFSREVLVMLVHGHKIRVIINGSQDGRGKLSC